MDDGMVDVVVVGMDGVGMVLHVTQGRGPMLGYEPLTGAMVGCWHPIRRASALRYVMLPLQGIDNPEGV